MYIPILLMIVVLAIPVVAIVSLILMYNRLVSLKNEVKNAWSGIDVQLNRRHDLIPNLVETAKGYLEHEKGVLENVIKARQQAVDVKGVKEQGLAENLLTQSLKSLFAVVENYPNLKANQTMLSLMDEITTTENRISFARHHYNDTVMGLNIKTEQFPTNFLAKAFHFEKAEMFEIEDASIKEVPKVEF